jgi:23S rRNA (guanine745-N1)-methyltransferase
MLLCTVRGCGNALENQERRMVCGRGHSFDIARSGYVNLLQPQDRRSKDPGDSGLAVLARRRLHDKGITQPLAQAIKEVAAASQTDSVLDVGCGDGYYLGQISEGSGAACSGVDISLPAIEAAARRYSGCQWVVANADRFIPWSDGSFSVVLSITGRMNPEEFRRVLRPSGRLLVAIASPEDLIELRGEGRDRRERTITDFGAHFKLQSQRRETTIAELDAASVEDVLLAVYRPMRQAPVQAMRLTFSLDLLLFEAGAIG